MTLSILAAAVATLSIIGYVAGHRHAWAVGGGSRRHLHSLPVYHGAFVALVVLLPPAVLLLVFLVAEGPLLDMVVRGSMPDQAMPEAPQDVALMMSEVRRLAAGGQVIGEPPEHVRNAADLYARLDRLADWGAAAVIGLTAAGGFAYAWRRVAAPFRARNQVERIVAGVMVLCSIVAILTTIGIVLSVLFEALRFFGRVSPLEFLFGLEWQPRTGIREEQVAAAGSFGMVPLFVGTLLIMCIAMAVAVPLGLLSAIYLSEYAAPRVRAAVKPMVEILAGIPTVVYGFFAAITVAPFLSNLGDRLGLDVSSQSALAAGSVMGIMIIPFVSSLSDDVINAVPQALRQGAAQLGATQGETIVKVVLPAALPGIVGAVLLAISRAIGETMIVLMAAGLFANLTFNPLEAVTTVTVQIATLLTGDQRFDSAKTLSAFALGLVLFFATLALNLVALKVTQRYREKYD